MGGDLNRWRKEKMLKTKNIVIERFDVKPDVRLYGRLGHVGYSLKDAISELVDNAIDARIPGKKLSVEIEFDESNQMIVVSDNGRGMVKEEAKNAIILGKSEKKGDLGFFGLGLKTAGLALGNIIVIQTKQEKSDQGYTVEFDRQEFEKKSKWQLFIKSFNDSSKESGTKIIISDLLVNLNVSKADRVNNYFADRYKSFIKSGEVELFVNGCMCDPVEPDYIMEEPLSIKTARGDLITGFLRIQTKRLQRKQEYGFDLYKNKRIISSCDKIGFNGQHGEKALICGELNLDFCKVNFTKNAFLEQTEKYKAAENAIKQYLKPLMPLFNTKNLKKEKIEMLLEHQRKTKKIPSLKEFKELIKSLDRGALDEEKVFNNDISIEKEIKKINEEIEPQSVPAHTELRNIIYIGIQPLANTNEIIECVIKDKESLEAVQSNPMLIEELKEYAKSLEDTAESIKSLLSKSKKITEPVKCVVDK